MPKNLGSTCLVILGDQLFSVAEITKQTKCRQVFMAETWDLCSRYRYHKQKILMFFASMRHFRDELLAAGFNVHYEQINEAQPRSNFLELLARVAEQKSWHELLHFEFSDTFFEQTWNIFCGQRGFTRTTFANPSFLTSRDQFASYLKTQKQPKMQTFYQQQRLRLNIMVTNGKPLGGQWSYDADNRKKLPKSVAVPAPPKTVSSPYVDELKVWIEKNLTEHPGELQHFIWPVTRSGAHAALQDFIKNRLELFGPYEDAMTQRSDLVFHSGLSPALNMGLLTPAEVLAAVMKRASEKEIDLASLEGFVRQLIGWREFIFGFAVHRGEKQQSSNFFQHKRRLGPAWYKGTTGIDPLDACIKKALRLGYVHHIERLMILSNIMLLSEIHPDDVFRWFMEMFVDSADWVMIPNVYGMGQFADGGMFATKPYIAGSNYLLKMSDEPKGPWSDALDGLYWRFIDRHRAFFGSQPRMSMMVHLLEKIPAERYEKIRKAAEDFIERTSTEA